MLLTQNSINNDNKVQTHIEKSSTNFRCPTLSELPSPPPNRSGWPWTEECKQLPDTIMPNDSPWPRVTIVTASYNQAQFIEETIRSVLLQGYPDLEYIIIDGGSTDGSVDIIRKYEPWLTYWVSEPDRGQSHAINKGFERATGEIIAWLNSDDVYLQDALEQAAVAFENNETWMVYGDFELLDAKGIKGEQSRSFQFESFLEHRFICQPASFQKREVLSKAGFLQEKLYYVMDMDWWLRIMAFQEPVYTPISFCRFRTWDGAKTFDPPALKFFGEILSITRAFFEGLEPTDPRLHLQNRILSKLNLLAAEASFSQNLFEAGGQMLTEAISLDETMFFEWQDRILDALLFTACGDSDRPLEQSQQALSSALETLNKQCSNLHIQTSLQHLVWKLQILKGGQLSFSDAIKSGRRSVFKMLLHDRTWVWRQKGWVGRTVLGPTLLRFL